MVRVTVGCSTACGALEPPVSPASSAQAAWGVSPMQRTSAMSSAIAFCASVARPFAQLLLSLSFFSFPFPACVFCTQMRGDWARAPAEDRQRRFAADNDPAELLCYAIKPRSRARSRRDAACACTLPGQVFWLGRQLRVASQWRLRAGFTPGFPCSGRLLLACDGITREALARDSRRK